MKKSFLVLIVLTCFAFPFCNILFGQENESKNPNRNLNMLAIGYQIGGLTYMGIDYEYRFSKYIGLNVGAGYQGYTAGFKFHTCPCKTGPFLNISYKDGGFGKIATIDAELGGVLVFFDKLEKIGLMGQIGFGNIINLTDNYNQINSKDYQLNDLILAFGIGISWYINK